MSGMSNGFEFFVRSPGNEIVALSKVDLVPFRIRRFRRDDSSGQKQQPDDRAVLIAAAGRRPHRPQLVIGQNALADLAPSWFLFVLAITTF